MPTDNELFIQIESDASSALAELDELTARLTAFKKSVGSNSQLQKFTTRFTALTTAINSATIGSEKIETIGQFATSLQSLNGVKISESIANQIQRLNDVVNGMDQDGFQRVVMLTEQFVRLNELRDLKLTSVINGLQKISELATNIQTADFTKLRELVDALVPLRDLASVDSRSMNELASSMRSFSNSTKTASTRGKTFNTVLANIKVNTLALALAVRRVTRIATSGLSTYGDYIETLNLFSVSMDKAAGSAYNFATKAQDALGIDLTQWMKAQGVFMSLAKGFGVMEDNAAVMSQNLTQLAYDISSFYNIDVESAIEKVRSGFSGQIRPVRDLGYDLSMARLEAIALSMGIDREVSSMTQAEKSQLRYIALMTQLTHVQGDLARTIESPTNQLRLFNAQIEQMQRSLGLLLLPVLNKVLPYLNAMVRVLKMIMDEVAAFFGYTLPGIADDVDFSSSITSGVEELEDELDNANGTAEKLKNTLASFDEINLIGSKSGGNGNGGDALSAMSDWSYDLPTYDFLGDATENKAKQIAENMMNFVRPALDDVLKVIGFIKDHIDEITKAVEILGTVYFGVKLYKAIDKVAGSLNDLVKGGLAIVIGLQFSYAGGKDIADGDTLVGLLKSGLGAALAGLGGYWIAGVPGLVAGVTLGLVVSLKGYFDEKEAIKIQEMQELFYTFDDGKRSVEEFTTAWHDYLEQFKNPEIDEKQGILDQTKQGIDDTVRSINSLRRAYALGLVDTTSYVEQSKQLFEDLSKAVEENLTASVDLIIESLNGEIGMWGETQGYVLTPLIEISSKAKENIQKTMDEVGQAVDELNEKLLAGDYEGNLNAYFDAIDEAMKPLKDLGIDLDFTSEKVEDFYKGFSDMSIDYNNFNDVIFSIQDVATSFAEAKDSIEKDREDMLSSLASTIQASDLSQADKDAYLEYYTRMYNDFYDMQIGTLETSLKDALSTMESGVFENWSGLLNEKGLKDAVKGMGDDMVEFNKVFQLVFDKAELERPVTAFTDTIGTIEEYVDHVSNYEILRFGDARKAYNDHGVALERHAKDIAEAYKEMKTTGQYHVKTWKEITAEFGANLIQSKNDTEKTLGETANVVDQQTQMVSERYGSNMLMIVDFTKDNFMSAKQAIENMNPDFIKATDKIVQSISNEMGDPKQTFKASMQNAMKRINDVSTTDAKKLGENIRKETMKGLEGGNWTTAFTDLRNNIEDAFNGKKLGTDLTDDIEEGISDGTGGLSEIMDSVRKKLGKPFDTFGADLYSWFKNVGNGMEQFTSGWGSKSGGKNTLFGSFIPSVSESLFRLKGYASGGFPDSADLFYANENGTAEFIGTMGGRTAVANNTEIIQGVSDGVYRAIKDTGLVEDVKKISKKSNTTVFAPSVEAGRVMSQSQAMYNNVGGRYQ